MGSAPASLADNPFLITLLLEMQTTIFLRTEMSRKTEYVHNPCFLSANILKILGVFAENQINFHMRDTFSAGGQQLKLNDELLPFPLPHVVGELLESATLIKNYLLNSDDLDLDISEFRPELMLPNRYEVWLNDIWKRIHQLKPYKRKETIEELGGISLAEWIDRKYTLSVK